MLEFVRSFMHSIFHDVLIIGAGLAGQRAAIEASQAGLSVGIVSKKHPLHSASISADYVNPLYTNKKKHFENTVYRSDFLADQDAVQLFSKDALKAIEEIGLWKEKKQSFLQALFNQINPKNTTIYSDYFCLQLIIEEKECKGAVLLDIEKGKIVLAKAAATLLATGGCGNVFSQTSNDKASTGDGLAAAFAAGIPLQDMEFIQFNPFGKNKGLIEKERTDEKAFLTNIHREKFMKKYAPKEKELAAHDVVTKAIMSEIGKGKGVGEKGEHVFLNKGRRKKLVSPTAHYCLGGIPTDLETRVIMDEKGNILKGLFAAGENACVSIHGANRMNGNSLIETLVFGKIAGCSMTQYVRGNKKTAKISSRHAKLAAERIEHLLSNNRGERHSETKEKLQKMMTKNAGVLREKKGLQNGIKNWEKLFNESQKLFVEDKTNTFNTDLVQAIETQNLILISQPILESAIARKETRGCHIRTDYPKRDDKQWLKHTLFKRGSKKTRLFYKPVTITKQKPAERYY
jgi:succinate dehydrogenase / fumarate reductase flavoprotein subunit